MKHFFRQLTKQFLHPPMFFVNSIQILFAVLLVIIVFIIVYTIHGQKQLPASPNTTPSPVSQQIPSTGQSGPVVIQPDRAVAAVENLKEIQDAAKAAATSHTKFVTEIDSYPTTQHNFYFIHVYETISDGNGNSHTATVGWYKVNPQTGTATASEGI